MLFLIVLKNSIVLECCHKLFFNEKPKLRKFTFLYFLVFYPRNIWVNACEKLLQVKLIRKFH